MANIVTTTAAVGKNTQVLSQGEGSFEVNYNGRTITPISHGTMKNKIKENKGASFGTTLTCLILAVGIILWVIGASHHSPNLSLSGKIIFGIGFVPILAGCLHSYCFPKSHKTIAVKEFDE